MLVSEYLSVFTQLYLRKWGQLLYQRIIQPFLRNTRMVGRFCVDDPHFCDYQSDLVPIVWCNQIRLTPSFCIKNQFVPITVGLI